MASESNDETNFPHKLLLTNADVSRFRIAFEQMVKNMLHQLI